jgi:hypothetical protein
MSERADVSTVAPFVSASAVSAAANRWTSGPDSDN